MPWLVYHVTQPIDISFFEEIYCFRVECLFRKDDAGALVCNVTGDSFVLLILSSWIPRCSRLNARRLS
jgi:hypothetical protein